MNRLCNYIRWTITKDMEEQKRLAFEAELYRPPPGEEPAGPWTPEAETSALADLGQAFSSI